jgi:hypothetical protein
MADAERPPDEQWPAVFRAYDFVIPSYQLMVNRYEAADGRLTQILTLVSTLLFSIPVFAKTIRPQASFSSPLFLSAITLLIGAAVIGIVGRQRGRVRLVNPMVLYDKFLHRTDWEFRKDLLYFAGQDFSDNAIAIDRKGQTAALMTGLTVVALLLSAIWLAN